MKREFKRQIVGLLDGHRIMTVATNRPDVRMLRITPEVVSILDYSKGFGHTDLVRVTENDLAECIEPRRHHWAGWRAA